MNLISFNRAFDRNFKFFWIWRYNMNNCRPFFFFQLSFIKVWTWQINNMRFCSNDFNTEVMHESSSDDFQTINFERGPRNFRKEKYPIIQATRRLASLKYLERITSWMRYVFRTGRSCSLNSLWEIIMTEKHYNICISANSSLH